MTIEQIKNIVEFKFEVDLTIKTRKREVVYARAVYFKLCREYTTASLEKIAKTVNKNHATIIHSLKLFDEVIMKYEPFYKKVYKSIKRQLDGKDKEAEKVFFDIEIQEARTTMKQLQDKLEQMQKTYVN